MIALLRIGSMAAVVENFGANSTFMLLAGIAAAFISYLWIYRLQQRSKLGPKGWPILGNYFEIKKNYHCVHDWITEHMKKSPTACVALEVFGIRVIYTGNPENVEYILKSNFANFPKGEMIHERVEEFLGNGIFAADGDVWKQHRKIASFEFSSRKLRDFSTNSYREHAVRLVQILDAASIVRKEMDFQDLAMRMTLDSICKVGFGVDYHALSPDLPEVRFAKAFDTTSELTQRRQFGITWKLMRMLNVGSEKQMKEEVAILDKFTYEIITARRAELKASNAEGEAVGKHDLLSRFMTAQDEKGHFLSDEVLRDAIMNFIIAGRDTSAVTLSWFVYCLCINPEVAEKCYEEMERVIAKGRAGESFNEFAELLTYESLGKLHYLHAAITETLRIYPAVPRDGKVALNDCVLPDGTFVKKGTNVAYHPYGMGRLESLWGPDAEQFRPERWLNDGVFVPQSLFKFTAFQAGPRVCLGKDAAYTQMKMTAAMVVRFFQVKLVPGHTVQYRASLVLIMLNGLRIFASRRTA